MSDCSNPNFKPYDNFADVLRVHNAELNVELEALQKKYSEYEHKMDCLISNLTHGIYTSSHVHNNVLEVTIRNTIQKEIEQFYEDDLR